MLGLHPQNPYRKRPDFAALATKYPSFAPFVTALPGGSASIDFRDPQALRTLTTVLLQEDWKLRVELREDRLCPTVSSRLDYVLHILDLEGYLEEGNDYLPSEVGFQQTISASRADRTTRILDIGTGHVAIYPLLTHRLRPHATIIATESDQVSYDHSLRTLQANNISQERIHLHKAPSSGDILFPLSDAEVDIVICNPPFYASLQELEDGSGKKVQAPFAAPTAAHNELITRGGEVAFVGQMINESCKVQHRCRWYTSLIGIYASLQPLVELLRTLKIENYFIKSIKPSRTTRWILGWSFGRVRLPDNLTRPEHLITGTSFARLLSPSNTLRHTPLHPPLSLEQLQVAVTPVLDSIRLGVNGQYARQFADGILLYPRSNTWSRAARRSAARASAGDQSMEVESQGNPEVNVADALFTARLSFIPAVPPSQVATATDVVNAYKPRTIEEQLGRQGDWRGATLVLHFLAGNDRESVDAFWKFLLNKAELIGSNTSKHPEDGDGERNMYIDAGRKRDRTESGVRGGRRGRGRVKMF